MPLATFTFVSTLPSILSFFSVAFSSPFWFSQSFHSWVAFFSLAFFFSDFSFSFLAFHSSASYV